MTKDELVVATQLREALVAVENRMEDSGNWNGVGICNNVTKYLLSIEGMYSVFPHHELMDKITKTWTYYSGSLSYPVPSVGSELSAQDIYQDSKSDPAKMWDRTQSSYAVMRWHLLSYLIKKLDQMINENTQTKEKTMNYSEVQNMIDILQAYQRGETIQCCSVYDNQYFPANWYTITQPRFDFTTSYFRVKPVETIYDKMDWSNIDKKFKYAARDANDGVYLYTDKPTPANGVWIIEDDVSLTVLLQSYFTGHEKGNCSWEHSLIYRGDEDWTKIDQFLREGCFISAIKEHRENGGRDAAGHLVRGLRESKDAIDQRKRFLGL